MPAQRVSRLVLAGVVVIGVALVEALVGAFASPELTTGMDHHGVGNEHLLAFIGMVTVFVGLLRSARPAAAPHGDRSTQQEDRDAVR
jgi:hypothetical protein